MPDVVARLGGEEEMQRRMLASDPELLSAVTAAWLDNMGAAPVRRWVRANVAL